jgi:cycloartenol synthase
MWKFVTASDSDSHPLLHSLNGNAGRQIWVFDDNAGTTEQRAQAEEARRAFTADRHAQKHSADALLRIQGANTRTRGPYPVDTSFPDSSPPPVQSITSCMRNGISFYETLQAEDGHWPGDYGGPMFLMPGMVIALYTTGDLDTVLSSRHKEEMIRYLGNHQNEDGGFGLHIEGGSTMFGTVLSYVTLRLLGVGEEATACATAREWVSLFSCLFCTLLLGCCDLAISPRPKELKIKKITE